MNNFTFYSPTLFAFGDGEEQQTGALVRRFGGSKVLLVTGGGSVRKNGAYDAVTASLVEAGLPWAELSGIQANPRSGKVYEGIDLLRREGCDFLLALGGGSVIDTAKAIGFGAGYNGDFWDFFTGKAQLETTLPVGVVLTIAAAGSEGSDSCVITQERGNLKWGCPRSDLLRPKFAVLDPRLTCSLPPYQTASGAADMLAHICERYNLKWGCPRSDLLRPKFAVLDPRLTCSLPPYQTASGAADMLAHICERYFTNTADVGLTDRLCEALMRTILEAAPRAVAQTASGAADMLAHICERYFTNTADVGLTDRLCEALMRTILEAAPRAVAQPDDYAARADLMWAGMLAHNNSVGVGREQDWASHQIEHELSAF